MPVVLNMTPLTVPAATCVGRPPGSRTRMANSAVNKSTVTPMVRPSVSTGSDAKTTRPSGIPTTAPAMIPAIGHSSTAARS